ncbi:MAG: exosortase E/protease, VPEID-CTERM system [Amaricoccus sp.]|uniref:exosortase E/protease, VPEID-CTERM system n=1 Tax=Amaricoccus sp. TaxID=1872485 RepID=UPI0033159FD6
MSFARNRLILIAGLLCLELVGLALAYQVLTSFECQATEAMGACRFLRSFVARAISILAALAVFAWARPAAMGRLVRRIEANAGGSAWSSLHFAGVALMFAPLLLPASSPGDLFLRAVGPWLIGATAAGVGALLWLAPPRDWFDWLREERFAPLAVLAAGFAIPDLAELAQPLWYWPALARATFDAVYLALRGIGAGPVADPPAYIIGIDGFLVHIAQQCSGIEGLAMMTAFALLYSALFRDTLRLWRFWLVVVPLGLALSWLLNVARIAGLILIGARISPDLAVNGFHSYAGWMFFTLLALALLYVAQVTPWLRKGPRDLGARPLGEDWTAARILPFVVFMLGSVAASALSSHPDLAYPLKAAAMAAALWFFRRCYARLDRGIDPVALVAGVGVGFGWILLRAPASAEDARLAAGLAGFGGAALALWATTRILGTVLLVPMIEELFFRGYVLARLDRGGLAWRFVAIAVSSALFAALHGRWLAAGAAGLVFACVFLRRGRLSDAIVAHVVANFVVAGWAVANGDWSAI